MPGTVDWLARCRRGRRFRQAADGGFPRLPLRYRTYSNVTGQEEVSEGLTASRTVVQRLGYGDAGTAAQQGSGATGSPILTAANVRAGRSTSRDTGPNRLRSDAAGEKAFAHVRRARPMDRAIRDAGQRMASSKRRMPRVEPARSRARPTGALGAVKASSEPAYPLSYNGAGEGLAPAPPSNPPLFALPRTSRMGAPPPFPCVGAA